MLSNPLADTLSAWVDAAYRLDAQPQRPVQLLFGSFLAFSKPWPKTTRS